MSVEPGYPVTLVHPSHSPAKIAVGRDPAVPERFPAIMVNGADSEAQYRALGYLRYGEPQVMTGRGEYPKMLRHPDYEPEVPDRIEPRIEDGRIVGSFRIPGKPAYMDYITVSDRDEERLWEEKGYSASAKYSQEEADAYFAGAHISDGENVSEISGPAYPKWVDGKLIERDPDEPELKPDSSYPRYEGGVVVPDPRFPEAPDPTVYPMWVHKDGIPGPDSILAKNRTQELEARRKHDEKAEYIKLEPKEPFEISEEQLENRETLSGPLRAKRVRA